MSDWSITCVQCGADLGGFDKAAASITLRPREDEEDRTYFLCPTCNVYTVWICIEDFFTDECKLFATGPVSREEGDGIVARIRECPDPRNMSCKCPTHREMESRLW